MRRNYISPEYHNNRVNGSFNMVEESNYFSAKMLEIEDNININNIDIIWYQKDNGEQLDFSIESSLLPYTYSPSDDKKTNHTLKIDTSISNNDNRKNTKWILEINLKEILNNYLYSTLKKYRTFEGVKNDMTVSNDINFYIKKYIEYNVINRYKLSKIELFIDNISINESGSLQYNNVWNVNSINEFKNYQSKLETDNSKITLSFLQIDSNQNIFNYYYNIYFTKI